MNAVLWTLNTVFLDGDVEKEGRNIEANVALLISAFQHPKGLREAGKHDDGLDAHLEERFMEWIYALGLEPPPAQHSPPGTAHTASNFGPETDSGKLVRLKKEMRELQHAFAKRPNARSQGINLDEEAFAAVSFRTAELERRVNQLKVKLLASTSTTVPTSSVAVVTPAASTPGVHDAADPLTPSSKGPPQAVAMQSPKPQHLLQNPLGGARSVRMDYGSSAMF